MLSTRYEDHSELNRQIPFSLARNIYRTKDSCGNETNWHENLEIQLCTKGEGYVLLDGIRMAIAEGDVVIVNSNVIHYTATEKELTYRCLIVDSDFCRDAGIDQNLIRFEPLFRSDTVSAIVSDLVSAYEDTADPCRIARLKMLLLQLLIDLSEHHTLSRNGRADDISYKTVKEAIRYIRDHYDSRIRLSDISRATATNPYTLAREFKKATDKTVIEYVNLYRCKKASERIADGATVTEAALSCGFSNLSFFTKTFKTHIGKLPSACKHKKTP